MFYRTHYRFMKIITAGVSMFDVMLIYLPKEILRDQMNIIWKAITNLSNSDNLISVDFKANLVGRVFLQFPNEHRAAINPIEPGESACLMTNVRQSAVLTIRLYRK